jgi:hypothetical protein
MFRIINTPDYAARLATCNSAPRNPSDYMDLRDAVFDKFTLPRLTGTPLTNAGCREILREMHRDDDFRRALKGLGMPYVGRASIYSDQRARLKLEALEKFLMPELKEAIVSASGQPNTEEENPTETIDRTPSASGSNSPQAPSEGTNNGSSDAEQHSQDAFENDESSSAMPSDSPASSLPYPYYDSRLAENRKHSDFTQHKDALRSAVSTSFTQARATGPMTDGQCNELLRKLRLNPELRTALDALGIRHSRVFSPYARERARLKLEALERLLMPELGPQVRTDVERHREWPATLEPSDESRRSSGFDARGSDADPKDHTGLID